LRGDCEQPFVEALELASGFLITELAPIHLQEVARGSRPWPTPTIPALVEVLGTEKMGKRCGWAAFWRTAWGSRWRSGCVTWT